MYGFYVHFFHYKTDSWAEPNGLVDPSFQVYHALYYCSQSSAYNHLSSSQQIIVSRYYTGFEILSRNITGPSFIRPRPVTRPVTLPHISSPYNEFVIRIFQYAQDLEIFRIILIMFDAHLAYKYRIQRIYCSIAYKVHMICVNNTQHYTNSYIYAVRKTSIFSTHLTYAYHTSNKCQACFLAYFRCYENVKKIWSAPWKFGIYAICTVSVRLS